MEVADQPAQGIELYIPHEPAVREEAVSTKVLVLCDASPKAYPNDVSLNDCLYLGPMLQNN